MDIAEVVLRVIPWLKGVVDFADIVLTATPSLGGLSPFMILSGFLLIAYMGHKLLFNGGY